MISIIVPIFNGADYLVECIESIINQTYSSFQLILVDDGSTDNTVEICKYYTEIDKRIEYVFQKNSGVSAARNRGITFSSGEYITFVDADDMLMPNALEKAIHYLQENDADMVTYGWERIYDNGQEKEQIVSSFEVINSTSLFLRGILTDYSHFGGGYPWNKLWRIGKFGESIPRFRDDLYYFEDLEWVVRAATKIDRVVVCPELLYRYRIRNTSATNKPNQIEKRELGYHQSIQAVLTDIYQYPQIYNWFIQRYSVEVVNGICGALKHHYKQLMVELLLVYKNYYSVIQAVCKKNRSMMVRCVFINIFLRK